MADHRCQKRLSLDRRTAIARTPAGGGSSVTTSYLWCGSAICQARDAGNDVTREYYAEGELVPGTTPATLYYGPDQIGSVRRVFASTSSAPAYSYDPYGVPLQATAPLTDFTYAGMFHDADSDLDLTKYRAYDPVAGRWLSRDPLGEVSDPVGNLYLYVGGNPISLADPMGTAAIDCSLLQSPKENPYLSRAEPYILFVEYKEGTQDTRLQDLQFYNSIKGPLAPTTPNPTPRPMTTFQKVLELMRGISSLGQPFK